MLAMSLSLVQFIGLFLLGLISFPACHAFEFDLPSRIPTNEPITVGYRMKFDGSDELNIKRWIINGTGHAAIRTWTGKAATDAAVLVSNPDDIVTAVVTAMRRNQNETRNPPLVDNLINIMEGLRKAAKV